MRIVTARVDNGERGDPSPVETLAREMDMHAAKYVRMTEELGCELRAEKTRLRRAWTIHRRQRGLRRVPPAG